MRHPCGVHTTTIAHGTVFKARNRSQGALHLQKDAPGRSSAGITCHCGSRARMRHQAAAGAFSCLWSERMHCLLAGWKRTAAQTMGDTTSRSSAAPLPVLSIPPSSVCTTWHHQTTNRPGRLLVRARTATSQPTAGASLAQLGSSVEEAHPQQSKQSPPTYSGCAAGGGLHDPMQCLAAHLCSERCSVSASA